MSENNAPTIEQARYLDELREKMWKDVTDKAVRSIQPFKAQVLSYNLAHSSHDLADIHKIKFVLNDNIMEVSVNSVQSDTDKLVEEISREIAETVMKHIHMSSQKLR